jgi:hypothetical protein
MKRVLFLAVLVLASPMAAWANGIGGIVNKHGSISISNAGIFSKGSQLVQIGRIVAPPGHALGSVTFNTGALLNGTILGGGHFAGGQDVSHFIVIGKGNFGQPKGTIFVGYFKGPVQWTLVSENGQNLVFELSGLVVGQLYNGRFVRLDTIQIIVTTVGQLRQGIGHIVGGITHPVIPEPGTLGLIGTGLIGIALMGWAQARGRRRARSI